MKQQPGGVPDVDMSADNMFVARVPIYGTCDAGRGFWKKLRHDIFSTGLKENAVIRALYIYQEDGKPKSMLATHVNDMSMTCHGPRNLDTRIEYNNFWTVIQ